MINNRLEGLNRLMETTEENRYRMGSAYGGYRLEQVCEKGGVNALSAYTTKAELLAYIDAFEMGARKALNK